MFVFLYPHLYFATTSCLENQRPLLAVAVPVPVEVSMAVAVPVTVPVPVEGSMAVAVPVAVTVLVAMTPKKHLQRELKKIERIWSSRNGREKSRNSSSNSRNCYKSRKSRNCCKSRIGPCAGHRIEKLHLKTVN